LVVNAVFLITMAIFLLASFQAERTQHYRETFQHLDETLGVLSIMPGISAVPDLDAIRDVEIVLQERTGVPHRLLTTIDGVISGSTSDDLIGQEFGAALDLRPFEGDGSGRAVLRLDDEEWLLSSLNLEGSGEVGQILLLRERSASEGFVAKFVAFHGVHVVVTVLAFVVLLRFLTARYVRRPIEQLAAHVQRVEEGEFRTAPFVQGNDEFAWLADRFSRMGARLRGAVQDLVRSEKYASVSAIAFRIAREMKEPLEALHRHIVYLEGVAQAQPDLDTLVAGMKKDRARIIAAVQELADLKPPEEG
jgi:methyl-accepting chemotaxis protein